MSRRRLTVVLGLGLGLALATMIGLLVVAGRRPPTDREQIQLNILRAAQALEQRRASRLMALVADDYDDGLYGRAALERLARSALWQAREIRVVPYLRSLEVHGDTAVSVVEAQVEVLETRAGPQGRPGATRVPPQRYSVTLHWRRGERGWQVIRAEGWQQAPADFGV